MSISPDDIRKMKGSRPIAMLTCYDYSMARAMDSAGIPLLLVGDSLGNVILGFDRTRNVTMQDMLRHTAAVARAVENAMVVADLPSGSYESKQQAIENSQKLLDVGAAAVKPEGKPEIAAEICKAGIDVMGHLGLLPQTAEKLGVKGKDTAEAKQIMGDAIALEKAGCFSLVLECVPEQLGKEITAAIGIPTIGIGAGRHCDGQVLVSYDMLGLFQGFQPRFVKRYANLSEEIENACRKFKEEVEKGVFPGEQHCSK